MMLSLLTALIAVAGADEPAATDEPEAPKYPRASAYGAFVGGGAYEIIDRRDNDVDDRQNRFWTPALARIGLMGRLSDRFSIQSEVEFNAGPYGTSVWEGQAAIQVRNQLVRYQHEGLLGENDRLRVEVGRLTDPASVNYVSIHTANLLLSDELARSSLLFSGFNRGNGARVEYTIADALSIGATLNAGNPTSNTATIAIGGTFPPFSRFYQVPWALVGRDARGFPQSTFHSIVLTPSLRLNTDVIEAQAALQYYTNDANTNTTTDEQITGTNLRAGARLKIAEGRFTPFVNASRMVNDVVEETNLAVLADAKYLGFVAGGGFDVNFKRGGFGLQYDLVYEEERGAAPEYNHFANAGATLMVAPTVFVSGRFAFLQICQENDSVENCDVDGRRQAMLTMTAVLGASQDAQP